MSSPSLSYLRPYRFKAIIAPFMKAFECAFELATPFLVRYIIDEGIGKNNAPLAYGLAGLLFLFAVLGFLTTMVTQYLASRVSADFGLALRKGLYQKTEELGERELENYGKDKILTLFGSDAQNLQTGVAMFMRLLVRSPLITFGSLVLSFVISWQAGVIFLVSLGLSCGILLLVIFISPKRYAAVQGGLDDMALYSGDALSGIRSVRAYEKTSAEVKKYEDAALSYKKRNVSLGNLNSIVNPLTFAFIYLALCLVVYLGGFYEAEGLLTTGEIVSLVGYLTASLASLNMFTRLISSLNKAGGSMKRLDAFLSSQPVFRPEGEEKGNGDIALKVDHLSFSFGGENAVDDVSFELKAGEQLGIIGGTGSGKSTLARLLCRLLLPTEGSIQLFGLPLEKWGEKPLRDKVSIVLQKPALYEGTIRDNLMLGVSDKTEEELWEALKMSLAYEFVREYKDGLDHKIEEGGANLSGGQRQRLVLARAFLAKPRLLILDDCLSALDYLSEKKVRENLSTLNGVSVITISQRTSSLANADEILVMAAGRIIGRGKHKELLQTCPLYEEIDKTQKEAR